MSRKEQPTNNYHSLSFNNNMQDANAQPSFQRDKHLMEFLGRLVYFPFMYKDPAGKFIL